MEREPVENSQRSILPISEVDHRLEDKTSHLSNHEEIAPKSDSNISFEEIRSIMEVIAATGKFWHDWDMLKSLLSFRLKQVLAEYPEAQVVSEDGPQPSSLSGETYPELVKRLDEALLNFIEGPPFTLQRLCEILLTPKNTYRSLSKLALALEKNLLVTSTLTVCTDPYPRTVSPKPAEPVRVIEESHDHSAPVPNGVQTIAGDGDEEMVEAEADEDAPSVDTEIDAQVADTEVNQGQVVDAEVHDTQVAGTEVNQGQVADTEVHDTQVADTEAHGAQVADTEAQDAQNVDTEMQEEKVSEASESNPEPSLDSGPAIEPCTASEENCPTPPQP